MADFEKAFARLMDEESISLSNVPGDKGGQTYAGVARNKHPSWIGWKWVDSGDTPPLDLVRDFYHTEFWNLIKGDRITGQRVAEVFFSQTVNGGTPPIMLMQQCVGVIPDGKVGEKTLAAINVATEKMLPVTPEDVLLMFYSLANVERYRAIGMKDKTQRKFWPGWLARALRIVK